MKPAMRRPLEGILVLASVLILTTSASGTPGSDESASPCGKGVLAEETRPEAWHGLARGISPMLDIIIPPLADQVAATGREKTSARPSLMARAERGFLTGAISAVVSAGLAALGTLEGSGNGGDHPGVDDPSPQTHGAAPASCPESERTVSGSF